MDQAPILSKRLQWSMRTHFGLGMHNTKSGVEFLLSPTTLGSRGLLPIIHD